MNDDRKDALQAVEVMLRAMIAIKPMYMVVSETRGVDDGGATTIYSPHPSIGAHMYADETKARVALNDANDGRYGVVMVTESNARALAEMMTKHLLAS